MTKDEILFIAIILLILVVGAAAKNYRTHHPHVQAVAQPILGRKAAATDGKTSARKSRTED